MNVTETNAVMSGSEGLGASANDASTDKALGRDDFLNLLVVQLRNQDPMDPMESAEFSAQLAQFSSLEQLTNMNDSMQILIDQQASAGNIQAVSYIGKHVKALGDAIRITDGKTEGCFFELAGAAAEAVLYISDSNGNAVRTMAMGNLESGEHLVEWDGKTDNGGTADDGIYTFEVVAVNPEGGKVPSTSFISANVTGITLNDGATSLMVGELAIPLNSVVQIEASAEEEASEEEPGDEEVVDEEAGASP